MGVDALKDKLIAIFDKLGCNILTERMEASYSLIKAKLMPIFQGDMCKNQETTTV